MPRAPEPAVAEYRLRLDLDFERLRWSGRVELDPPGDQDRLELDCEGLRVVAVRAGGRPVAFVHDAAANRLSFDLPPGDRSPIAIEFSGEVETKNLVGLYRSRQGAGHLVTSHCEPTGARRIFPCIDRPDRKARIRLTVRAPAELEVIANGRPRARRMVDGGWQEWEFEPTPEMSTYLFYLGVGRFDSREDRTGTVALRVAAPPGRGNATDWALRSAGRILHAYEAYYGIPYPLPKLDLVAVAEHAFGAMENWGAISFQESRLLVDEGSSTFETHDVFTTTAHEIAHQWFGNLVTMRWWDDIWLNESFASLMETKVTESLEPSFAPWDDFILRRWGRAEALDGDSLRATHPVRVPVERPEEIGQAFDEISYGKGSSVLAMFDRYLGEERFRAGVNAYLNRFRFGNARTEDLLASLERSSGAPVPTLAGPWLERAGLPVVCARSDGEGVVLSQRRFTYLAGPEEDPWPIPMVAEVGGRSDRWVFDRREQRLATPTGSTVLLNPGSVGFYRVLYDGPWLDRLLAELPGRPGQDAWAVLDDLRAFVVSGDTDWSTYARAVEAFAGSSDRLIIEALARALATFALRFPEALAVGRTARGFLARQLARMGVDHRTGEPPSTGIARDRVAFARARLDPEFAAEIAPRFDAWESLDPNLREAVAVARVRSGGRRGFEQVLRALDTARADADAIRLEHGLAWSSDPGSVRELLDRAITGRMNRSHILRTVEEAALNPAARDVSWSWLQQNLDDLSDLFEGSGYLTLLLELTLPTLGRGRAAQVRRFFEQHPTPEASRGLVKGLERLEITERLAPRLP